MVASTFLTWRMVLGLVPTSRAARSMVRSKRGASVSLVSDGLVSHLALAGVAGAMFYDCSLGCTEAGQPNSGSVATACLVLPICLDGSGTVRRLAAERLAPDVSEILTSAQLALVLFGGH